MHTCFRLCLRFSDAAYDWYVYACFLTQTSSPRFPSQTLRFSGFMNKAPSIQWRDHAGFAPASILAFYPAARKTPAVKPVGFPLQSAEKKEHKSSSVFSFSKKYFIIKALRSQAPSRYFSAFMRGRSRRCKGKQKKDQTKPENTSAALPGTAWPSF